MLRAVIREYKIPKYSSESFAARDSFLAANDGDTTVGIALNEALSPSPCSIHRNCRKEELFVIIKSPNTVLNHSLREIHFWQLTTVTQTVGIALNEALSPSPCSIQRNCRKEELFLIITSLNTVLNHSLREIHFWQLTTVTQPLA